MRVWASSSSHLSQIRRDHHLAACSQVTTADTLDCNVTRNRWNKRRGIQFPPCFVTASEHERMNNGASMYVLQHDVCDGARLSPGLDHALSARQLKKPYTYVRTSEIIPHDTGPASLGAGRTVAVHRHISRLTIGFLS
jgi:hypothetical protein